MAELRVYVPTRDSFDKHGYPIAWQDIKHQVRELAAHRCVRCGHPYRTGESVPAWSACDELCTHSGPVRVFSEFGDPGPTVLECDVAGEIDGGFHVEAAYRVLTTHHLNGDKADCRWWNLAALCQRCHLRVQGRVRMERTWPFEHTDWFRPYVAGFYAWHYLDEDLDRPAVEARLDELLDLELAFPGVRIPTAAEGDRP